MESTTPEQQKQLNRRSGIPVSKSNRAQQIRRFSSKGHLLDGLDYNTPNVSLSDTDEFFALMEDKINLKEANEVLISQHCAEMQKNRELELTNMKLSQELDVLRAEHEQLRQQFLNVQEFTQRQLADAKSQDSKQLQHLMAENSRLAAITDAIKAKFEALLPERQVEGSGQRKALEASEIVETIVMEMRNMKLQLSSTELQLYEANETIAELLENRQHPPAPTTVVSTEELKKENLSLAKVAQLMTERMKESVETTKRMEQALVELRRENEALHKIVNAQSTKESANKEAAVNGVTKPIANASLEDQNNLLLGNNGTERVVEMFNPITELEEVHDLIELPTEQLSNAGNQLNLIEFEADAASTHVDQSTIFDQSISNGTTPISVDGATIENYTAVQSMQLLHNEKPTTSQSSITIDNLLHETMPPLSAGQLALRGLSTGHHQATTQPPLMELSPISSENVSLIESNSSNDAHNLRNNTLSQRTATKNQFPMEGDETQQVPSTGIDPLKAADAQNCHVQ